MRLQPAKFRKIGLLILRSGLGLMLIFHGYPKIFGGPEMWQEVGSAMQSIGITFLPAAFGFLAGITEFFGGIFLILGLFFRPTLGFLICVMAVATATHIANGDPFALVSQPIELAIVFISLLFLGPGKYSLKHRLNKPRRRW